MEEEGEGKKAVRVLVNEGECTSSCSRKPLLLLCWCSPNSLGCKINCQVSAQLFDIDDNIRKRQFRA